MPLVARHFVVFHDGGCVDLHKRGEHGFEVARGGGRLIWRAVLGDGGDFVLKVCDGVQAWVLGLVPQNPCLPGNHGRNKMTRMKDAFQKHKIFGLSCLSMNSCLILSCF